MNLLLGRENINEWRTSMYFTLKERIPELSNILILDENESENEKEKRDQSTAQYREILIATPPEEPTTVALNSSTAVIELFLAKVKMIKHLKEKQNEVKISSTKAMAILHAGLSSSALERIKLHKDYKDCVKISDIATMWNIILRESFGDTKAAKSRNTAHLLRELYTKSQKQNEDIRKYATEYKEMRQRMINIGGKIQDECVEAMAFILSLESSYDSLKNHARNLNEPIKSMDEAISMAIEWMVERKNDTSEDNNVMLATNKDIDKKKRRDIICHYCKKKGHIKRNCHLFIKTRNKNDDSNVAAIMLGNESDGEESNP